MDTNTPAASSNQNAVVALYRRRTADFARRKEQVDRRANWISHGRVATFLPAAACLLAGWRSEGAGTAWFVIGGVLAAVFVLLVWVHERVLAESARFWQLSCINAQAAARVLRRWKQIPLRAAETPSGEETLAGDLDLFDTASLFHLVCMANTPMGIDTLKAWFLHPADPSTVIERQRAVAELAPLLDMRHELHRLGLDLAARQRSPAQFLQWAESQPWLAGLRRLKWAARCLPVLILVGFVLWAMDLAPLAAWMVPTMVNMVLGVVYRGQMHAIFEAISSRHGELRHYADLLQLIADTPVGSARLTRLQQQALDQGVMAHREIRRLRQIMDLANLRFSSAHVLVQSVSSWDFHLLSLLERWQRRNGQSVRRWFEALAEWEALASFAGLAHDNPAWAFPTVDHQPEGERTMRARSLGHPLIPEDRRVANDVTVGPPGTFLMVTGSNMSGKSTLLRAIGANVVLAQAGAPVCAERFSLPPVLLATSMRIRDSLADGVSYYMAELKRLKQVVDAARDRRGNSGRTLLYLLDEVLQGTNTAERQIAVRRVVSHLLAEGAIGGLSTHDLQLASAPPLEEAAQTVHFRETIHNESGRHEMTFDYKLREGPATTSNALKLLEMVGLDGS